MQTCNGIKILFRNIPGLDQTDLSRRREAASDKHCFELWIRNVESSSGAVDDLFPRNLAPQTTEISRPFCSELQVTMLGDFICDSQHNFEDMQENERKWGTIHSIAIVDAWKATVMQPLLENKIRGRHSQDFYEDHHSKNQLEAISQVLGLFKRFCTNSDACHAGQNWSI